MDEPAQEPPPQVERLRARMKGGGLPVPPVLPVVAALALLVGLTLGYRLAPASTPSSSSTPAPSASPDPTPGPSPPASTPPSAVVLPLPPETPGALPTGGVTQAQAVAAAREAWPFADADVISVQLVPAATFGGALEPASPAWVWRVEVRASDSLTCQAPAPETRPALIEQGCSHAFVTIVVDYKAGDALYAFLSSDATTP
jgi:hypothetical protein